MTKIEKVFPRDEKCAFFTQGHLSAVFLWSVFDRVNIDETMCQLEIRSPT